MAENVSALIEIVGIRETKARIFPQNLILIKTSFLRNDVDKKAINSLSSLLIASK